MRRSVILAALLFMAPFTACQVPSPEAGPLSEEDVAVIRDLTEREVVESLLAEDWDRFVAAFAVRMPPNEPSQRGRAVIRSWAEANWGPLTTAEFTMTVEDLDGRGDLAYVVVAYSATVEVPGLDEAVKDIGKGVIILRKQADGRWLASVSIYNADSPPPISPETAT
jgi:ketosteroid isomerase-like protein